MFCVMHNNMNVGSVQKLVSCLKLHKNTKVCMNIGQNSQFCNQQYVAYMLWKGVFNYIHYQFYKIATVY